MRPADAPEYHPYKQRQTKVLTACWSNDFSGFFYKAKDPSQSLSLSQSHALLEPSLPEEALPWVPFILGDPGAVSQLSSRLASDPTDCPWGHQRMGAIPSAKLGKCIPARNSKERNV